MSADKILKSMKDAPKLDCSSYKRWSTHFRDVLSLFDIESFIDEEKDELLSRKLSKVPENDVAVQKQDTNIRVALSQLVPDTVFHLVGRNYTARECWKNLQDFYCPDPIGDLDDLIQKFWSFTVEDDIDVDEFVQQLSSIRGEIDAIDSSAKPTDTNMKKRLLAHFIECCDGFYMSISIPLRDSSVTFQTAVTTLRSSQMVYRNLRPASYAALAKNNSGSSPIVSSPPKKPGGKTCAYCQKLGHLREGCFLWLDTPDGSSWAAKHPEKAAKTRKLQQRFRRWKGKGRESNSGKKNPDQQKGDNQNGSAWIIQDYALASGHVKNDDDVVLDTGATNHIFHDESLFTTLSPSNNSVQTASGVCIPVTGIGSVNFRIFNYNNEFESKVIQVDNVWLVPSCSKNLVSGTQLLSKGFKIISTNSGLGVYSTAGELIATAKPKGGLLCFNTTPSLRAVEIPSTLISKGVQQKSTKLLHNRFAHIGSHFLKNIPVKNLGLPLEKSKNGSGPHINESLLKSCHICNSCKQVERINRGPSQRSSTALQLIHSDTWGKCHVSGILGSNYFVTFTDDFSRESEVYLLKSTKDVPKYFQIYRDKKELQTGNKIKAMRFDGGSEYKRIQFGGIIQQISAPYTQHQNGTSERLNRSLITMARCMLAHAQLPLRFWDVAVQTASYLRNRLPLGQDNESPFETMNGSAPGLSHIKVWGCVCYVLIKTNDPHRYKLSPTSIKGIFIGYCESITQYRVYVPSRLGRNKIIVSANVNFQEDTFWDWKSSNTEIFENLDAEENEDKHQTNSDDSSSSDSDVEQALSPTIEGPISQSDLPSDLDQINVSNETSRQVSDTVTSMTPDTPLLRRSNRERRPAIPRSAWQPTPRALYANNEVPIPQTYKEAINGPNEKDWKSAIQEELNSLKEKNVFTQITHVPHGRKPVGSRWVFTVKSDGRFKARLVAQGYSQVYGLDYNDTYSPTLRADSLRLLLGIATLLDWEIHQVDVKTAYLEGDLCEEIYIKSPEGLSGTEYLRVDKALYGLKQSGRMWYQKLGEKLSTIGFHKSNCDGCIYFHSQLKIVVGAYVDDLVICGESLQDVQGFKENLSSFFEIKDLGEIGVVIGWEISRDRSSRTLKISQSKYILNKIRSFGLEDAKTCSTPLEGYDGLLPKLDDEQLADESSYASAVGSLGYASNGTRPDISFATARLGSFNSSPTIRHWNTVCRVLRYLKGTSDYCLTYCFGPKSRDSTSKERITIFSDSDFASDVPTRRSISGYVVMLGGGPLCWQSRRQKSISTSTAEAEYVALFEAAKQALWLTRLVKEFKIVDEIIGKKGILSFTDNQSALAIAKGTNSAKTKHIDIAYHFVQNCVQEDIIDLNYVPTNKMLADILTKPLPRAKAEPLCQQLFGIS